MTLTINLQPETGRGLLAKAQAIDAKNLVELFETSPFKGLGMTFERDKDDGREIGLGPRRKASVVNRARPS